MSIVQFPVGDWSGDGHSQCDYFLVDCNKSVQELREIHFAFEDANDNFISKLCKKFEDSSINEDQIWTLVQIGFLKKEADISLYADELSCLSPKEIAVLWLALLKFQDDTLEYAFIEPVSNPSINFYGRDEKGRHLSVPGYGAFLM